ncbi:MAG: TIGR04222 domain-containing membrane protein [Planctomycetes bacterium]|nr:TIGR04222 domain-containing membrane protein [Planctomycetota bacterium]
MTPDRADLLARILAFDIDGGEVALPFAARLARENGWCRSYAERVIEEYKRFAFLAAAGNTVCPSEDVDAAWHLHLTYTKSYWKRFCGEVLGRPLHHEPTKGGPAEGEKHLEMYADTLTAYREAFGRSAPADVWPPAAERFGADMHHRAVNTTRNWVIPKAPVKRATGLVLAFAVVAVLVPGCDGGWNPFALKNADFLTVLAVSLVGAVCVGRVVRSVLRKPNPAPEDDATELDWEQTAYLAGGAGRLMTAAVARVVGRGLADVTADGTRLRLTGPVPNDVSRVEKAVLDGLPVSNDTTALKPLQDAVEAAFAREADRMEMNGLTLTTADKIRIGLASLIPLALVLLCLATPRLVMGVQGNKPTGYLQTMMAVGGVLGLILALAGSLRLSNRGQALLAKQKERHEALKSGTKWEHNEQAGMAVALFGTAVLAGTAIATLQTWYPRQTSEASGGCSTGCGSGCGGGGGCGGGCGGGGD